MVDIRGSGPQIQAILTQEQQKKIEPDAGGAE